VDQETSEKEYLKYFNDPVVAHKNGSFRKPLPAVIPEQH
jgi:hypothetical protein